MKHIQEQEAEPAKPMNLNFEVEQVADDSRDAGEESDSSMASIFGDGGDVDDEDGGGSYDVGSKRTIGESTITADGNGGDAKRQKKFS